MNVIYDKTKFTSEEDAVKNAPLRILYGQPGAGVSVQICFSEDEPVYFAFRVPENKEFPRGEAALKPESVINILKDLFKKQQ